MTPGQPNESVSSKMIPVSLKENTLCGQDLISFGGSANGQLPGGHTDGPDVTCSFCTISRAPYPRMQDLQQLRRQLSPIGQRDLLRPLSHWRNLSTGHGPEIPTKEEMGDRGGSQAPVASGYL